VFQKLLAALKVFWFLERDQGKYTDPKKRPFSPLKSLAKHTRKTPKKIKLKHFLSSPLQKYFFYVKLPVFNSKSPKTA
jgi:hypothetical protein